MTKLSMPSLKAIKVPPAFFAGAMFFGLLILFSLKFPTIFSPRVLANLGTDSASLGLLAIGAAVVIIAGGIDLSVAAVMALCALVMALASQAGFGPFVSIILAIIMGLGFGLINGLAIVYLEAPAFIVTLTNMFLARGLAVLLSTQSIAINDPMLRTLGEWTLKLGGGAQLSAGAILMLALFLVMAIILAKTHFGRHLYAIGQNGAFARLLGTNVGATTISAYVISGLLAGIAGVAYGLYTMSGNASAAVGGELDAIAAVVIGGVALSGGRGNIIGVFFGVMVGALISTAITFDGTLSSWWSKIATGVLLLGFLLVQRFANKEQGDAH